MTAPVRDAAVRSLLLAALAELPLAVLAGRLGVPTQGPTLLSLAVLTTQLPGALLLDAVGAGGGPVPGGDLLRLPAPSVLALAAANVAMLAPLLYLPMRASGRRRAGP